MNPFETHGMMSDAIRISLIVAAADDDAIGRDNSLLWHLPNDMRHFKNMTWGMPVVMGRRTFESIGSKPLPGRFNIVLTRQMPAVPQEGVWHASHPEAALEWALSTQCREVFIAGGGEVYAQFMAQAHRVYLTRVHTCIPDATVHFRGFQPADWQLVSQIRFHQDAKNPFDHSFQTWQRG